MQQKTLALPLLFILGILWAIGYTVAHYVTTHGVAPFGYAFWMALGPASILLLINIFFQRASFLRNKPDHFYLVSGLFGIALPNTIIYYASEHLPSGLLATIINIGPILIYVAALILKFEKFVWQRFIGALLGFVGLMLIILPKASLGDVATFPWALFVLLTPVCFAIMALYISKRLHTGDDILTSSCGMLWGAVILLIPFIILTHSFHALSWPLTLPDKLIIFEILNGTLAYLILFKLLSIAGVVFYSMVDGVVIVSALFFANVFFGDKLNPWTFAAVVLILAGIILVKKTQKQAKVKA